MTIINLAGGVALAMFGVRFLRKGLDRLFGHHLMLWLERMTPNHPKAFAAGIAAGVVAPSSTAQSLMALQLLSSGKLNPAGMLAIVLGASLGITLTIQLLALRIQDYAIVFILSGVIAFQFLKSDLWRGIGQIVLSLGFIFLGMNFISLGARDFTPDGDLAQILHVGERHPWMVLVIAALLTMVVQSSTAAIGLGIGFTGNGMLSLALIIPWVLGVNYGTTLSALAVGWTKLEGRRLGIANLLSKTFFALPILLAQPWVIKAIGKLPGALANHTVNFHTLFNLTVGLGSLPFLKKITSLAARILPAPAAVSTLEAPIVYLDQKALETPSLALAHATREVLRMADEIMRMLTTSWSAHIRREAGLAVMVQAHDDRIDQAYIELKHYLSLINEQAIGERESHWQFTLMSFSNELESVGDIISKNLYDLIHREVTEGHSLTVEDAKALNELYLRVIERLEIAISLLTTRDTVLARQFIQGKEPFNEWCRTLERDHYSRLRALRGEGIRSSVYFLEMLNFLRRINSHISSIGYAFIDPD